MHTGQSFFFLYRAVNMFCPALKLNNLKMECLVIALLGFSGPQSCHLLT